eukprot:1160780-Pelagomonas_calceolata.AAC.1
MGGNFGKHTEGPRPCCEGRLAQTNLRAVIVPALYRQETGKREKAENQLTWSSGRTTTSKNPTWGSQATWQPSRGLPAGRTPPPGRAPICAQVRQAARETRLWTLKCMRACVCVCERVCALVRACILARWHAYKCKHVHHLIPQCV